MFDLSTPEMIKLLAPLIVVQFFLMTVALIALKRAESIRFLPKWGWALIIIFINTLGPVGFFIFGRERDV